MNSCSITLLALVIWWCCSESALASENNHDNKHGDRVHQRLHLHHLRHHRPKANSREANSSACVPICDPELAAVAKWLNGTDELKFLYEIIPPSVKQSFLSNSSNSGNVSNSNATLFNGSLPVDLNSLYNASSEWPILTYISRFGGHYLSRPSGLEEFFKRYPQFSNVWGVALQAFSGGSGGRPENIIRNLESLFGVNGSSSGDFLTNSSWTQLFNSTSAVKGFEDAAGNAANIFRNISRQ